MGVILHKKQNYSGVSPYKYVPITTANYNALPQSEKMDSTKVYFLIDAKVASARIDDTDTSTGKVWSSKKVSDEIDAVQDQVDDLGDKVAQVDYVSVTGNGVKTYEQLFNELYALVDFTKITRNSYFAYVYNNSYGTIDVYDMSQYTATSTNGYLVFTRVSSPSNGSAVSQLLLQASGSRWIQAVGTSRSERGSEVLSSGMEFKIFY